MGGREESLYEGAQIQIGDQAEGGDRGALCESRVCECSYFGALCWLGTPPRPRSISMNPQLGTPLLDDQQNHTLLSPLLYYCVTLWFPFTLLSLRSRCSGKRFSHMLLLPPL